MVKIRQNLVSTSKYSIKAPYAMTPKYITIHNTANDASANNEAIYHNSNNNQISFHYAVDDKEIVQVVPDNRTAWHCGDGKGNGNMKSIGIEICYSKSGGARYEQAEENAVQLTAQLLVKHNLKVKDIKQHHYWSGKNCPHRIRMLGTWETFLNRVQKAYDALVGKNGTNTPTATQKAPTVASSAPKQLYKIKSGTFGSKAEVQSAIKKVVANKLASEKYITILQENGKYAFQTGTYADKLTAETYLQKMKNLKIIWVGSVIKA